MIVTLLAIVWSVIGSERESCLCLLQSGSFISLPYRLTIPTRCNRMDGGKNDLRRHTYREVCDQHTLFKQKKILTARFKSYLNSITCMWYPCVLANKVALKISWSFSRFHSTLCHFHTELSALYSRMSSGQHRASCHLFNPLFLFYNVS